MRLIQNALKEVGINMGTVSLNAELASSNSRQDSGGKSRHAQIDYKRKSEPRWLEGIPPISRSWDKQFPQVSESASKAHLVLFR
jgi:hypothetical protein